MVAQTGSRRPLPSVAGGGHPTAVAEAGVALDRHQLAASGSGTRRRSPRSARSRAWWSSRRSPSGGSGGCARTSPGRTGSWKTMVLSLITASGSPEPLLQVEMDLQGQGHLAAARRPVMGPEPDRRPWWAGRWARRSPPRPPRRPRTAGCRSPPTAGRPDVAALHRELPLLVYCSTPISSLDVRLARWRSCHHSPCSATPPPARAGTPAASSSPSVSDTVGVADARPARSGRSIPASTGPTWRNGPAAGCRPSAPSVTTSTRARRARYWSSPTSSATVCTGRDTGVGPGQLLHPLVPVPGGEGRPEVGPDLRPGRRRRVGGRPTAHSRGAGRDWRRTWARWPRPPAISRRRPGTSRSRRSAR